MFKVPVTRTALDTTVTSHAAIRPDLLGKREF